MILAPQVLFLDEPTTGLDPRGRNEVWAAIRDLVAGGTTVLLTTQYLDEADQLADRIAVIDRGRTIADRHPGRAQERRRRRPDRGGGRVPGPTWRAVAAAFAGAASSEPRGAGRGAHGDRAGRRPGRRAEHASRGRLQADGVAGGGHHACAGRPSTTCSCG